MNEWFSNNYENNKTTSEEIKNNISSFDSSENLVKDNYLRNDNKEWAKELAIKQLNEGNNLKENLEIQVLKETREELDKEAMINEAKIMLYEKLWINENQNDNSSFENFEKWIVDELVLNNYDLAIQVWETNWKIILDWLSQLASWEWLKQVAKAIWESFWSLLSWNAYEKWKSVAELWLIWTWVWAWVYIWKKWVKLWIKEISKLRVNKERIVESTKIKNVINDTKINLDNIISKKELDFKDLVIEDIAKLWNKERVKAWKEFLWKDITPSQENAIIKAHEVWINREWAWLNNYTFKEKLEKVKILDDAWFDKSDRRILLEKWVCWKEVDLSNIDDVVEKLSTLEKLDISVAKEMIEKWYLDDVMNNFNSFDIDSIVDIVPNQDKIINYYKDRKAWWKTTLEWNYWTFISASKFKIWWKNANDIDWFRCTQDKIKSYTNEDLISKWVDVSNPDIKKQFDEYVEYVWNIELKVKEIIKKSEDIYEEFNTLLKDVWELSKVSDPWTYLLKNWKVWNWVHNNIPLKKVDRIMEKVLAPWFFDWNLNKLWDIVRWTLEFDKIWDLYKWLYILMESWIISRKWWKILIKDNIWNIKWVNVHPHWFKNINSSIKISDNSLVELQFQLKSIMEATNIWIDLRKWTVGKIGFTKQDFSVKWDWKPNCELPRNDNLIIWHDILELWRTIPNSTNKKELLELKNKLNNLLKEIYKQAWDKAL